MSIDVYRRYVSEALDKAVQESGGKYSLRTLSDGTGVLYMVFSPDITEDLEEQEIIVNFQRDAPRPRFIQLELPFVEGDDDDSDSE
jgi:hypothetical protein